METTSVFSEAFKNIIGDVITTVQLEGNEKEIKRDSSPADEWSSSNDKKSCSYCRVEFPDSQVQREHYKLDWHRYNLKQSLFSRPPITEDDFSVKTGNDDLSSISGSDSEKEDTLDTYATAQGKIFLKNKSNQVISLYKCLMLDRKEEISENVILNRLRNCVTNQQWTILMLGGGHFAGAVFKGTEPILHKTFHCYTVRAGQGGSQGARDNKSGGSQPKSAGASLRRYNEQALVQHVKSIVETWKTEIENSSLIMYRAAGPYNRGVLFGGSTPLLDRANPKLRTIPFSTRRATFTELKRVHQLLTTVNVYDSLETATKNFSKQISPDVDAKRNKVRTSCINRAKSRETVERPLPTEHLSSDSESETDQIYISTNDQEISFHSLKEFEDSLTPEQRKKIAKKKKPKKSKSKKLKELEDSKKKELISVISNGQIEKLKILLDNYLQISEEPEVEKNSQDFINKVVDESQNTLLHVAAQKEQIDMVKFLLDNDANPCLKNKSQLTAYTCTQSKEVRECLRQFSRDNPDKYNYNKAQIPVNALTNEEMADKKKAMRKVKREKEKEKKKENEIKRKEEEQKERFLKLSDREKRALAAERRILNQQGVVTKRCFLCGADIAGKVPFEYLQNLFCSIDCLKAHRLQHPIVLS
ncbi:unnamed protein product [Diabrotica balteata]|uniref:VLRF1 domain-containing protein n=1 Tax=Diabrotica balteata TaxID=107213 RepID=A0A9N9SMX0_DIABA|nr:unnamed protein product [Diabrotica balteata]